MTDDAPAAPCPCQCGIETIVAERAGVLAHARRMVAQLHKLEATKRWAPTDSAEIIRLIRNFANDVATGLHVEGECDPVVRRRMAALVRADAESGEARG